MEMSGQLHTLYVKLLGKHFQIPNGREDRWGTEALRSIRIILVAVFTAMTFFHITYICVYRLLRLLQEIGSEKENKTIIFVETKRKVDEITRSIRRDGFVL
jgi:hypothetical protein